MSVPDFHLGDKAKATIGTTTIKGLNAVKVPGVTRSSVKVEEFDRDFDFEVPTSAAWEKGSISGNYVRSDTTGQRALRQKLFNNEGLNNLRLYENNDDFWAPDLAKDANSVIYVAGMPGPDISKSGIIPFSADLMVQGLLALFAAHISGTTLAFTTGTITDSGDGFETAGFAEGDTIIIDGSPSNDGVVCLVTAVAAGTLTVSVISGTLTAEAGVAATTVHGGHL
jgi:hypothetical protein